MSDEKIIDMINREKALYKEAQDSRRTGRPDMIASAERISRTASELTVEISKAHP